MLRRSFLCFLTLIGLISLSNEHGATAQESLADVVARCEQSVVRIEVEGKDGASLGSGFVIDASGIFVTNLHVLSGAQTAVATFPNGSKFEVRGTLLIDKARDLCIAKIDGQNLPTLKIAADPPRKGERVTALGSPQGLSFSASTGIVSAIRPAEELGPEIGRPEMKGTWIQVDAALSGGNSGGPLINDRGEVVGVSTLASQGAAQNLNFGISGTDVLQVSEAARNQSLIALPDGVGKLETGSSSPQGKRLARPPLPKDAMESYVEEGRSSFDDLMRGMRQELSRISDDLKEMRRGKPYLPPNAGNVSVLGVVNPRTDKTNYFFRSQAVKDREVNRVQTRVRELQAVEKAAKGGVTNEALFALLSKFGPRLDPRRQGSIGFMFDAVVLLAFDDNGVIIMYEEAPYLLWVESASGLFEGSELNPVPVFVAGTETVEIPGQPPRVVTLLRAVTEAELKGAILGDAAAVAAGQLRVWKDNTGKFEIEATLVQVTEKEVVLKKKDGATVKVPLDRLSADDRKLLGK